MVKWKQWLGVGIPETYVLVGEEGKESHHIQYVCEELLGRKDVHIIRAQESQSIEDAVKNIEVPANIILVAHDGNNKETFQWHKDEEISYSRFFTALPQAGIDSILLTTCHSGVAVEKKALEHAPAGTLVLTASTGNSVTSNNSVTSFIRKTKSVTEPIGLFLEILDNFDPQDYYNSVISFPPSSASVLFHDFNPEHALSHIIGIGGNPPRQIDLKEQLDALRAYHSSTSSKTYIKGSQWNYAIRRVQDNFNTAHYRMNPQRIGEVTWGTSGQDAEIALQQQIVNVAAKIRKGEQIGNYRDASGNPDPIKNADELRIACALTAAYLDESGQIDRWKKEQIAAAKKSGGFSSVDSTNMVAAVANQVPEKNRVIEK